MKYKIFFWLAIWVIYIHFSLSVLAQNGKVTNSKKLERQDIKKGKYELEFESNGKLTSPPKILFTTKKGKRKKGESYLHIGIRHDTSFFKSQSSKVEALFKEARESIWSKLANGVYDGASCNIIEYEIIPELDGEIDRIQNFKKAYSFKENGENAYIPKMEDLIFPIYTLDVEFFDHKNISLKRCGIEIKQDLKRKDKVKIELLIKDSTQIPKNCAKITYQLRRKNNIYEWIENIQTQLNKQNTNLVASLEAFNSKDFPPSPNDCKDLDQQNIKELQKNYNTITDGLYPKLETIYKDVSDKYIKLQKNYLGFLWLNKGNLSDPFQELTYKHKIKSLEKEIMDTNEFLEEPENKLEYIQSQIEVYKQLAIEGRDASMTIHGNAQPPRVDPLANFLKHKIEIQDTIKALKKDSLALKKLNSEINAIRAKNTQDEFLYNGILLASTENNQQYMRHHNAANKYILMETEFQKEITEEDFMHVLVHNENRDTKLSLDIDFSLIENDVSWISAVVGLDDSKLAPEEISKEEMLNKLATICSNYIKIHNYLNSIKIQLAELKIEIPKEQKDSTEKFVTRNIPYQFPTTAPNNASYKINVEKNNSDGKKETEEVGSGDFRVNKLYRFRFKAGIAYSWLEREDYTINDDNTASLNIENHGLDAVFGLQGFFTKQDIRSPKLKFRPFGFVGLSISKDIVKNLFLGAGIEPINGLALMGGMHLGESEMLVSNNGELSTKNVINNNWFVSLGVDLNLFSRIFGFGNLNNPFK